jgi:hypothetical protein
MRRLKILHAAILIGAIAVVGCFEDSHQEVDDFAKLVSDEVHLYKTTHGSCENVLVRLKAFYDDQARQKRLAEAAVAIINNEKQAQDEYLVTTIGKLQPPVTNLTDAVFAFVLQCKDTTQINAVRTEAGRQVKQFMEAADENSVTRLYMMDDKLRDLLQTVLCVHDQETEERIARLQRERSRKSDGDEFSGDLGMMGKVLNAAGKLVPPGDSKARERIKQVKKAFRIERQMIKGMHMKPKQR